MLAAPLGGSVLTDVGGSLEVVGELGRVLGGAQHGAVGAGQSDGGRRGLAARDRGAAGNQPQDGAAVGGGG